MESIDPSSAPPRPGAGWRAEVFLWRGCVVVNPSSAPHRRGAGWRAYKYEWRDCVVVNPTSAPLRRGAGWRAYKYEWRDCVVVNPTLQPPPRINGERERESGLEFSAARCYPIPRPFPQQAREGELNAREHASLGQINAALTALDRRSWARMGRQVVVTRQAFHVSRQLSAFWR